MTPAPAPSESITALLAQARLGEAVAAATTRVKSKPLDTTARILLADLLCLQGAIETADAQLQIASQLANAEAIGIARLRGLLRAEAARRAWFKQGAVPTFLVSPTPRQQQALRLAIAWRAGDAEAAAGQLAVLERAQIACHGTCDGTTFDDFRDADDLLQENIETLGTNGQYYWLAPQALSRLTFAPPRHPRDLVWRRARAVFRSGEEAELHLPAQYCTDEADDEHRLARRTDWTTSLGGVTLGRGQRVLMVGGEPRPVLEIGEISFADADA
jgi:type VI secretion system protein ImpE